MTSTFMKLGEKGNLSGAGMWAGLGMGETNSERKVNRIGSRKHTDLWKQLAEVSGKMNFVFSLFHVYLFLGKMPSTLK